MAHLDSDRVEDHQPSADEGDVLGEEDEDDIHTGHEARTAAEYKCVQTSVFHRHCLKTAHEIPAATRGLEVDKDATDEDLSLRSLLARQEDKEIIKDPREYQIELFERAKEQNTIAVLDTGSGKTLIAVLLLRHIIDRELEDRAAGKAPKISFFLVASVTLVYQQFAVLHCNLDHKIARFCGAMNTYNWTSEIWDRHFEENKVIVCTADVLYQCLMHSYITMKQINLLIFDEAHHAKKNHSYARIIKEYYLEEHDMCRRPRVFGMTASPVDAKVDVVQAALELEALLSCRIATTSDMSTVSKAISKPTEQVLRYSPLQKACETTYAQALRAQYGHIQIFEDVFTRAEEISAHLGCWCADAYLQSTLGEDRIRRMEMRLSRKFNQRRVAGPASELDGQLSELRKASKAAQEYILPPPTVIEGLSSKVLQLHEYLATYFSTPSDNRCIVFIDRRYTARLLSQVFEEIGGKHMKPGFLIGSKNHNVDDDAPSYRQQVLTLAKFRKGVVNCLFATSVAEEGLDVPHCNLVVRFDMYKTMIQYVQSRGRARHRNSKFLHMVEAGNSIHEQVLQEVRYNETIMRGFCQSLPKDRRLVGNEDNLEALLAKEKVMRVYTEPATGAKLTYSNALAILAHFTSAIPTENKGEILQPSYMVSSQGDKFICEVILPNKAPVERKIGKVCTKKTLAKRSAAFSMCMSLRESNYLNDRLLPTYQKHLPAMRSAALAKDMHKSNMYPMRVKPSVWEDGRGTLPTELHILIFDFPDGLDRSHRPMALLTRTAMPEFSSFPLYLNDGRATDVISKVLDSRVRVTEGEVAMLTTFMLRVFKDIFNKTYQVGEDKQMSYWLAPVRFGAGVEDSSHGALLDWATIAEVASQKEHKWSPDMPHDFLIDKFLVDPWDGGIRYFCKSVDPSLKPLDPVPADAVKRRQNKNILDYTVSLFKKAREARVWNIQQPVLQADRLLTRRNMLATPEKKETTLRTKAFVCPEPLRISVLPSDVVATCAVFPAIIWRFESYLIALETCSVVGIDCRLSLALEAITKDSDNSGDHGEERINFQSGMGPNYERLEFIGDCFLKMATSISVFVQKPDENEFEFHVARMLMLCNKNMFNVASDLGITQYIRSLAFSRRLWYPRSITLLEGKGANAEGNEVFQHSLGQKTIADVCEALIGAAFTTHYKLGAWKPEQWEDAIRAVSKVVKSENHSMQTWSDYSAAYKLPEYQTAEVTASQRDLAEKVEHEHSYHFRYPRLLRSAFQHPSLTFLWERLPSYQRLEFLGDSLLDMTAITHIFYRYPDADPQWMTEHKMAMVSNKFLGALCVKIGFHRHLRYSQATLERQVREYVADIQELESMSKGRPDYWATELNPPKCMSDVVEAYVGAIFIDSNFDYGVVQEFFDKHIKWYFEEMSLYDRYAEKQPTTHLTSILQQQYGCQRFRYMSKEMPGVDGTLSGPGAQVISVVMIHCEVVADSRGKSQRYSLLRAAHHAAEAIKGLAPYEFRSKFKCDCRPKQEVDVVMEMGHGPDTGPVESTT